jgi:hypothetical protein
MPNLEKEEAIALFERGNRSVELVRDWSPEALADLIASINCNYQGAPEVKGALQALYEQRRSEEAHRKRVRRVRCSRVSSQPALTARLRSPGRRPGPSSPGRRAGRRPRGDARCGPGRAMFLDERQQRGEKWIAGRGDAIGGRAP